MWHERERLRTGGLRKAARWAAAAVLAAVLPTATARAEETYHYYFGNTHAHSQNSDGKEPAAEHFRLAKAAGYDFYCITDHALAKYPGFTAASFEETRRAADQATDRTFVAIAGFEFSENDGPGGKGHLNCLNTPIYLDATGPKVSLPVFYDWLVKHASPTTAVSFNHPSDGSYNGFDYLTPERRDQISMFEVINSGKLHYGSYLVALNKGWRVAPIAGNDSHGTWRIVPHHYRTGVLAPELTRDQLLRAMRERRVYCTWDRNLRVAVRVNGQIMGLVLKNPKSLAFDITVADPDTGDKKDRVTRIEIIGDGGATVESKDFSAHDVSWQVKCDAKYNYCFVKVFTADKGDTAAGMAAANPPAPAAKAGAKRTPPAKKGPASAPKAASEDEAPDAPAGPQARLDAATAYSAPVWIEKTAD